MNFQLRKQEKSCMKQKVWWIWKVLLLHNPVFHKKKFIQKSIKTGFITFQIGTKPIELVVYNIITLLSKLLRWVYIFLFISLKIQNFGF